MLTSFTDSRFRVWNVGENAVVRVYDPPSRVLACYVHTIAEQVLDNGVRVTVIEVAVHLPATARALPYTVRDVAKQLFPSFDTLASETEPDADTIRAALFNCGITSGDAVLHTIAAVRGWLIHENGDTLANWSAYVAERLNYVEEYRPTVRPGVDEFSAAELRGARDALSWLRDALRKEIERRAEEARGLLVVESTTTTTTSTTTTSCNTPNPAKATTPNPAATRSKKRKGGA